MENNDYFEMKFYHQKTKLTLHKNIAKIITPTNAYTADITRNTYHHLPTEIHFLMKHTQDCLSTVLDIEKNSSEFPIILKSSNVQRCSGESNGTSSPANSFHPSTTCSTTFRTSDKHSSATPSITTGSSRFICNNQAGSSTKYNYNDQTGPSKYMYSNNSIHNTKAGLHGPRNHEFVNCKFLVNVGWCMKLHNVDVSDDHFVMLFMDGASLTVEAKKQIVVWKKDEVEGT